MKDKLTMMGHTNVTVQYCGLYNIDIDRMIGHIDVRLDGGALLL